MGNDMYNEEQLADAKVRADAAVLKESLTPDLGFDFVVYSREVLADKNHKDRDDLSCLAMEIMGALVSSIDRLQGRLDSLHRSKVEYGVSERLKLIAAVKANAAEADRLRLALAEATRERDEAVHRLNVRGLSCTPDLDLMRLTAERDIARAGRDEALQSEHEIRGAWLGWRDRAVRAEALLREVAGSGVEFEDERISYTSVQIDRETWAAVRALAAERSPRMSDAYKPEEPEAAKADVLPLEAPECNDGDDCCRYCGRGLQPCGACKATPPADAATEACYFDVVFDGPPEHVSGRFVEVENQRGASIRVGEWVHRPDGFWALRIPRVTPPAAASTGAVFTLRALLEEEENCGCGPLYCEHVVSVVVAARALVSALVARRGDA